MRRALCLAALLVLAGCTDPEGAKRALVGMGFTWVETTGYRLWGCSSDDLFRTGFNAVNAQGNLVTGVVCSSWLKGSTVRFD